MREPLITMLWIYRPLEIGKDWLNYKIYKPSDLTFHHIHEAKYGGKREITNGAILTRKAHDDLNWLEYHRPRIYSDLNYLFYLLNLSEAPPTKEYYREVERILKKVR